MARPTDRLPGIIDRRTFLRCGAIGGSSVLIARSLTAAAECPGEPSAAARAVDRFELDEATVADLQKRMETGHASAQSIAERYLDRIAALDGKGPLLRSVLETNPHALADAKVLDEERKAGKLRGPLHGIPVLLKDNIDTAGPMMTTAGSLALEGAGASNDAFIVGRLREAGAVILGKTNLSEWANVRSTRSTSGWSGRGGQCRNPYALDRNTSGSSSGTGAAIAASFACVGVGTETDGSIVSPSNNCGLVGVKPTLGLVSRTGIIPIAHSQDTAGPMARTVRDAAILLTAMAGVDARDAVTAKSAPHAARDYVQSLDPDGLKGARIGIPRKKLFGYSAGADRVAAAAIDVMKQAGATIIDPADIPHVADFGDAEFDVLLYEFKADLNAYLAGRRKEGIASLGDLIAFNDKHKDREMPYFGQEIFEKAQKKGPLTDAKYLQALRKCRRLSRTLGIDAVMTQHRLDALVCPTSGPAWLIDLVNGDYGTGGSSSAPAVAGYPHITVPGGFAFGLPVGISFIGRAWSEPTLFKLAYAFEQATKHRKPPNFAATVELDINRV
jgi:amidase